MPRNDKGTKNRNAPTPRPQTFHVTDRAGELLQALSEKLGWNQHQIVSRAIELLWEVDRRSGTDLPGNKRLTPTLTELAERLDSLEKRIAALEKKD